MGGLFLKVIGLPRWVQALGALGLTIGAAALWLFFHDRAVIRDHERETAEAVATASASASAAATEAVRETKGKVEQTNDEARKAAAGSNDPLGDGLRRLRQAQGAGGPGPR